MIVFLDTNLVDIITYPYEKNNRIKNEKNKSKKLIELALTNSQVYISKTIQSEVDHVLKRISKENNDHDINHNYKKDFKKLLNKIHVENVIIPKEIRYDVKDMCIELCHDADYTPLSNDKHPPPNVSKVGEWGSMFKEINRAHKRQSKYDVEQLQHFAHNERENKNIMDKKILAECITIKNEMDQKFYICSNDRKFFATMYKEKYYKSNIVTQTIKEWFDITCLSVNEMLRIFEL